MTGFSHILANLLFGYTTPPEMIDPRFPGVLQRAGGLLLTLLITILGLALGSAFGLALAVCQRETAMRSRETTLYRIARRTFRLFAGAMMQTIRGLPVMILIMLTFHLPYRLFGIRLPDSLLAIAAFSLYSAVYFSEILRAGFRSVDPGLRQAGKILGLTRLQVLRRIDVPLAVRSMMPDVINLAVTVFKDSSALAIVAVPELTYSAKQMIMAEPIHYEKALFATLVLYWTPATALSALAYRAERRCKRIQPVCLSTGVPGH